jgi:hypothetical protein
MGNRKMSRIKQALIFFYIIGCLALFVRTFEFHRYITWLKLLQAVLPALVALSVTLYALGVRPVRFRWFWRCVPFGYVAWLIVLVFRAVNWEYLRKGYYSPLDTIIVLVIIMILSLAFYLSFRFSFLLPSDHSGELESATSPAVSELGSAVLFCVTFVLIVFMIIAPLFNSYRTCPPNDPANYDLRNAATAQAAYFVDAQSYSEALSRITGSQYGFFPCEDMTVIITGASWDGYTMSSYRASGGKIWSIAGPGGSVTVAGLKTK